ncbi:MAG: hypothetical protein J6T82_08545 [Bacteroidaceae bacterium]|nr:hypothetical protein [Bacteroidaceae bacterium]
MAEDFINISCDDFKYFHGEEKNPYPDEDIRSKFWHGEMMFHYVIKKQHEDLNYDFFKGLINDVKEWRKELSSPNNPHHDFAERYNDKQITIVFYIAMLFGKWCPYDDLGWIFEY